jgi:hypothetical protein
MCKILHARANTRYQNSVLLGESIPLAAGPRQQRARSQPRGLRNDTRCLQDVDSETKRRLP